MKFFSILLVLVALIASSGFLYNKFKDKNSASTLVVFEQSEIKSNAAQNNSDSQKTEETGKTESGEQQEQQEEQASTSTLPLAPDFTVYDINGNAVKLSDFKGKPIVLNFWASWCGPCQSEMPDFEEVYKQLGTEVQCLMVNLTDGMYESVSSASSFISKKGYTFPVFYDTSSSAADAYSVYSIPTTFFIDADGHLVAQSTGAISSDTLLQGIDMIR